MLKLVTRLLLLIAVLNTRGAPNLFNDPIVAKGKGVEVHQSEVDDGWVSFKANRAASGEAPIPGGEPKVRAQVLDKLIATQLLLAKATLKDREDGKHFGERYLADLQSKATSEAAFKRQLIAAGTTFEEYRAQVIEQAIVKTVIDRELRNKEIVTDQDILKFYTENPELFKDPEKFRVRHILFATRRIPSGTDLPAATVAEKKVLAAKILARARAGEDFAKLAEQYSDDSESKLKGGELSFSKGGGTVPIEFESASATLKPGQISDLVETVFGFHIIKLEERVPAATATVDKVQDRIREAILQSRVQKKLSDYVESLKKEADVKITLPAP